MSPPADESRTPMTHPQSPDSPPQRGALRQPWVERSGTLGSLTQCHPAPTGRTMTTCHGRRPRSGDPTAIFQIGMPTGPGPSLCFFSPSRLRAKPTCHANLRPRPKSRRHPGFRRCGAPKEDSPRRQPCGLRPKTLQAPEGATEFQTKPRAQAFCRPFRGWILPR